MKQWERVSKIASGELEPYKENPFKSTPIVLHGDDDEKWSQARIDAWVRYVRADEVSLESWERNLKQHEKAVENAKLAIEKKKQDIDKQKQELAEQGFYM